MTWTLLIGLMVIALVFGEVVARQSTSHTATVLALILLAGEFGLAVGFSAASTIPIGPPLVALLAAATMLSRPTVWREPSELARLVETALLTGLCFFSRDEGMIVVVWLASFVPGLRWREKAEVSRRAIAVLAAVSAAPLVAALVAAHLGIPDLGYPLVVIAGAIRMGVAPFSPMLMANYDRLSLGRAALVAAVRPSVPLIIVVRSAHPEQIELWAPTLQAWAAVAAIAVAVQGVAQREPRRSLGAMAATQSSIVLYGLVSPGHAGILGALIQWAGLGIALVGVGVLIEAIESRVGHERARTVRGLLAPAPGLALLLLLFAATLSGFPGTSGFAGEDLILEAPAIHALPLRALLLAATALNGVTMLLLFARTFLGPLTKEAQGFPPLTYRERAVVFMLASLSIMLGAMPQIAGIAEGAVTPEAVVHRAPPG